ncbi:MAG: magnesium/cobalt efflux protein, partial [Alcanivorax sp.]|nr:magnesium/cobalt efflux protein [Alcanivorax sp.]
MIRQSVEETGVPRSWIDRISHFLTGEPHDRDQLIELLREARDRHLIDGEALAMIEGVLQVSEMRVRDIMVPRSHLVVVQEDLGVEDMLAIVAKSGHSRLPVIDESLDEV